MDYAVSKIAIAAIVFMLIVGIITFVVLYLFSIHLHDCGLAPDDVCTTVQ